MSDARDQQAEDTRMVHLVSQEGESFDVLLSVGRMSELVKTMIDEDQDEEEAQEIPLPNVKSSILAKVIEFAQHYRQEPMNEIEKVSFRVVSLLQCRET
jgi:S-phase kinase-associated protein 1